jgi:hypothetical protein
MSMTDLPSPSSASRPDLDWSQIRETMLMLNLAIAQMEMAMRDSGDSVGVLTHSFTSMYEHLRGLTEAVQALPDSLAKEAIQAMGAGVSGEMQQAIIAFQFYDRLNQRLAHVSTSLAELTDIVGDPARLYNPQAWHALQQQIRSKYTMEDEKLMFDTLLQTGNVGEALERFVARKQQEAGSTSDIELF